MRRKRRLTPFESIPAALLAQQTTATADAVEITTVFATVAMTTAGLSRRWGFAYTSVYMNVYYYYN